MCITRKLILMKYKFTLLLAINLILSISVFSQQMVKTKTIQEFFDNIESGKKLILDLNHYKLEDVLKLAEYDAETKSPKNIKGKRYDVVFTSWTSKDSAGNKIITDAEFYIEFNWLENFQIVGRKTEENITKLTSSSVHNTIFTFKKCKNILLRNVRIGHWPEKGFCDGDVIKFEDCENVELDNCELFGSGLVGLTCEKVKDLKVRQTTIEDCTDDIMTLNNAVDVVFNECIFQNTPGALQIFNSDEFKNVDPITFNGCIFSNLGDKVFSLDITKYETIKVLNSTFYGYEESTLTDNKSFIELDKNKFKKAKK